MKRALQTVWRSIADGLLTLTAAIIVLMLCAVAFSSRQRPSSAPALAAQPSPAVHDTAGPPDQPVATPSVATPQPTTTYEYVHGYKRKDGTTVKGYYRTKPDSNKDNNWSEKGNTNPFTGQAGSKAQ